MARRNMETRLGDRNESPGRRVRRPKMGPGHLSAFLSGISVALRENSVPPCYFGRSLLILALGCLLSRPAGAAVAHIQYHQGVDESLVAAVAQSLPADRTLHFRYDPEFADDHVFPNGITMGQFHAWVTELIDAWNRQSLMPLRLSVERGSTDAPNTIKLDEAGHDTGKDSGVGGWGYQWIDSQHIQFGCGATINVSRGYADTREAAEGVVKHELGHCLTLLHSVNRASVMTYLSDEPSWDAATGFFQLDDLLGIRAVWAREAPSFGAVEGHLVYPDGTGVGGGDVVALEANTGEVLASAFSDGNHGGRFRIELLAGHQVQLIAHPLHADQALFGDAFINHRDLTPGGFEPTEFMMGDRSATILVPNSGVAELPPFVVAPPADPPLLSKEIVTTPMLPGERAHLVMHFKGLSATPPPQVSLTMTGLAADNVAASGDHVEFDVTASPGVTGVSGVEVRSGAAENFEVGRVWVRPADGLIRVTDLAPLLLVKGQTTEVAVQGIGLEAVTGVQVMREGSKTTLPARLAGQNPDGSLRVQVDVPATGVATGPWLLQLQTPDGPILRGPEPQPRLWVGTGSLLTINAVDGGDVILNQPARFSLPVRNVSGASVNLTSWNVNWWTGGNFKNWQIISAPAIAPNHSAAIRMQITPTELGPLILYFQSSSSKGLETVSEVRLWVVPKPGP